MPGRGSNQSIADVRSDISSIQMGDAPSGAGDMTGEYSPIGGEGRKGCDAYGTLSEPSWTRIDAEIVGSGGDLAKKGEMGVGYGQGRTFSGKGRRAQD